MRSLHIDLETFSSVDLKKYGMHKYVDSPDFEIMICAYAFDDDPVIVLDLKTIAGYHTAMALFSAHFKNPDAEKHAWNAPFEMCCISKQVGQPVPPEQWRCSAVKAASLALPRSLGEACRVLGLPQDKQKDKDGKALIQYFCKPCKPTKRNGGRTRNLPEHDPEKWERFKAYCGQDVEAERAAEKALSRFPMPDIEWSYWAMDQAINNRGARVDMNLVDAALKIDEEYRRRLMAEATLLTEMDNPNSVGQLKEWLQASLPEEDVDKLRKEDVKRLLHVADDRTVTRVLQIRQELAKTSVTKYKALRGATCADGRIKGTLLFYGATHTGRWAGRVFQPQNLPQNHLKDLGLARDMVMRGNLDEIEMLFPSVSGVLSELIRTAIVPKPDRKFIVADFSAIEARVIAWLAGEEWRLEVFRTHGKIYEASAAAAFHVPFEIITKKHPLRQRGKVLELACGFQGGEGAVAAMDKDGAIPPEERREVVRAWREASPNIVQFWRDTEDCAKKAIRNPGVLFRLPQGHGLGYIKEGGYLFCILPSGRRLAYPRARLAPKPLEWNERNEGIEFQGTDQNHPVWGWLDTYGGKLVENIVQAVARDLLTHGMSQVDFRGFDIVLHIHDEAVVEASMDTDVETIETLLAVTPEWAEGLPLRADGYETLFYKKDD